MSRYMENLQVRKLETVGQQDAPIPLRVNTDVAAAGSTQADAAAIYPGATLVTGADDAKGVILSGNAKGGAPIGSFWIVKVGDGADLKVYPPSGAAINAIAADGAITVVDDVSFLIWKHTETQFYTLPLLPS